MCVVCTCEWKMRLLWNYQYELIDDFYSGALLLFLPLCVVFVWHLIAGSHKIKRIPCIIEYIHSIFGSQIITFGLLLEKDLFCELGSSCSSCPTEGSMHHNLWAQRHLSPLRFSQSCIILRVTVVCFLVNCEVMCFIISPEWLRFSWNADRSSSLQWFQPTALFKVAFYSASVSSVCVWQWPLLKKTNRAKIEEREHASDVGAAQT